MNEDQDRVNERAEQLVESHHHLMEELLNLRKKHGLSQGLVGERMGISQPAVASFDQSAGMHSP
jgi:predicted XRE-type DNA-binding protein